MSYIRHAQPSVDIGIGIGIEYRVSNVGRWVSDNLFRHIDIMEVCRPACRTQALTVSSARIGFCFLVPCRFFYFLCLFLAYVHISSCLLPSTSEVTLK